MEVKDVEFQLYSDPLQLGSHMPFCQKLFPSVSLAVSTGMKIFQMYLGPQQAYNRTLITPADMHSTQQLIGPDGRFPECRLFTHASLIYNLAGKASTKQLAWSGDKKFDSMMETCILKNLEYELDITSKLNGGVTVHPGSFPDRQKGIEAIVQSLDRIKFPQGSFLLLENSASQGNTICKNLDELAYIINKSKNREHLGVTIDFAHTYGAGLYDLSQVSEMEQLFVDFDSKIGLNKLKLIHLNDSQISENKAQNASLGSKKDRHEYIGCGHIWCKSFDSLYTAFDICRCNQIPMCLETTPSDFQVISALISKE